MGQAIYPCVSRGPTKNSKWAVANSGTCAGFEELERFSLVEACGWQRGRERKGEKEKKGKKERK
jgi:hypothetical protein